MNIIKDNKKKMKYNKAKVEMTTIASPEAKVEMTDIASPEAKVEMTVIASPEAKVEMTARASPEAKVEMTTIASPEAKVEMTDIASPEAKVEMTVIASPEATVEMTVEPNVKIPKKRGRKPKGGTIIANIENKSINIEQLQNIILHLKCNISELQNNTTQELTTFQFKNNKSCDLNFMQLNNSNNSNSSNNSNNSNIDSSINPKNDSIINPKNDSIINPKNDSSINANNHNEAKEINETKLILQKLEKLSFQLHIDKIYDKKSNCFFCTCEFDNNPIYIPKFQLNKLFHVYGCFCTPECACGFLMNDNNLDTATRFERYYLLNYIYGKIYNYEKNIKPAPSPYYLLDKYHKQNCT